MLGFAVCMTTGVFMLFTHMYMNCILKVCTFSQKLETSLTIPLHSALAVLFGKPKSPKMLPLSEILIFLLSSGISTD